MELNLASGVALENTTKVDEVLHRGGVDVGDTREVEDDGAKDGLGQLGLTTSSLLLVAGLLALPVVGSRVFRVICVSKALLKAVQSGSPFQGRSPCETSE